MDIAYAEQDKREYELTKHISLSVLNPSALLELRETGECMVDIPEVLFDMDYAGHYLRRIKSMRLTIPCITGPYTSVSCKLTLLKSRVRKNTFVDNGYAYTDINDDRFIHDPTSIQSVAVSNAQNDSGLFELNFRDERYLPFERAGSISTWRLELPQVVRQFDYDTISDVILHMNYTAREGGDLFKDTVNNDVKSGLNKILDALAQTDTGLYRLFSFKQEFSNQLHHFLYPPKDQNGQTMQIDLMSNHFPYFLNGKTLNLKDVHFIVKLKDGLNNTDLNGLTVSMAKENITESQPLNSDPNDDFAGLPKAIFAISGDPFGNWSVNVEESNIQNLPPALKVSETVNNVQHVRINPDVIENVFLLISYVIA